MNKVSVILTSDKYLNGRFFNNGVVRKTVLGQCEHKKTIFTLKLISANRQDFTYPKYIPQIKQSCADCSKFIKFASQTPELINKFNQKLQEVVINGR